MSGAYQVDHVHYVPDVPEAVWLADDQSDLVVGRFDPRVARAQANRVRDVLLVAFDLGVQFPERQDPSKPFRFSRQVNVETLTPYRKRDGFFNTRPPIKTPLPPTNHPQPCPKPPAYAFTK